MEITNILRYLMRNRGIELFASNLVSLRAGERTQQRLRKHGAEYPHDVFYVIRRPNDWGIMTVLYNMLRYIDFAIRRGWIPVVDMETVHNLYLADDERGRGANAWESFFAQPCGYSLEDISAAKNVIVSSHNIVLSFGYNSEYEDLTNDEKLAYWQGLAHRYIHFTPSCSSFIDEMRTDVFGSGCQAATLGVYCRGTDYLRMRPKNHNIQPEPDVVIAKAQEALDQTGLHWVYLVTEDQDICDRFAEAFGNRLLVPEVKRYRSQGGFIWQQQEMLERSRTLNGLEYLSSMKLLSECAGFIGGVTGGTAGMMLLREGRFPYEFFFNLGHYQ